MVKQRSKAINRKILNTPELRAQFKGILDTWVQKDYAEEVFDYNPKNYPSHNFLNLFPVIRTSRTTSKMRIVSDDAMGGL